jgi:hypothetical protein
MIGQANVHMRAIKYVVLTTVAVFGLGFGIALIFDAISESGYGPYIIKYGALTVFAVVIYNFLYLIAETRIMREEEDRVMEERFKRMYIASGGSGGKEEIETKTYTGEK